MSDAPTADQFFDGAQPPVAAPPQAGFAHDVLWSSKDAGARILSSIGYGFDQDWGAKQQEPDLVTTLRQAGVFNDYQPGHDSWIKSANEAILRPAISSVDALFRLPPAVAGGVAGGLRAAGRIVGGNETIQPQPTNLRQALAAPFGVGAELAEGAAAGAFMNDIGGRPLGMAGDAALAADQAERVMSASKARAVGAVGEGEAGYFGAEPITPENMQTREGAAQEAGITPPHPEPPPPDVHALARRIDPETFQTYDALAAERDQYREQISLLGRERVASPETAAAQAQVDEILGKVNGVEDRLTKAAAGRLADAQVRLDAALNADTPEMRQARLGLMNADFAMRDLAVPVSQAYDHARDIAPQIPEEASRGQVINEGEKNLPGEQATGPLAPEPTTAEAARPAALNGAQTGEEPTGAASGQAETADVLAEPKPGEPLAEVTKSKAIGNPRSVEGTGETATRGLSREVEASAIESDLTEGFGDLPEYKRLNMKDQADKVVDFMDKDYEVAKSVAMGTRQPPRDIHPASVLVGVEKRATAEGDVATLQRLAISPFATRITTAAQTIRILGERDKASPLNAIREVQAAREAEFAKRGDLAAEKAQTVADIQKEMRAAASKPDAFASFLKSLEC